MSQILKTLTMVLFYLNIAIMTATMLGKKETLEVAKFLTKIRDEVQVFIDSHPNTNTVATGYAEIETFGKNVIAGMVAIRGMVLPQKDKVEQAEKLYDSLFDKTLVYQPKKGKDATLLNQFKADASVILDSIENV